MGQNRNGNEGQEHDQHVRVGRAIPGSTLHTDEAAAYARIGGLFYDHHAINHSAGEYVYGDVHTNSIESVWALLKRGLMGVYHHASPKHLGRYVDEFTFRLNDGNVQRHTMDRMDSFISACAGRRITYKELTHEEASAPRP